jgi:hypothetical protein
MWANAIAMFIYGIIWIVSAVMVGSGIKTVADFPSLQIWRPDLLAQTGICNLLFMTTVIWLQAKSLVSGILAMQVGVTGVLLFLAFSQHGFPERSMAFAIPHLLLAVGFSIWNIVRVLRRPG